jgi:hypothetical protein
VRAVRKKKESEGREEVRRKKIKVREKVEMWQNTVFPMFCGSGGSKSRLAKAAEPSGEMRDEQLHAVVAPSRFGSQNVKTSWARREAEHFWKSRCSKSARRCGAKHILMSKV